MLIFDKAAYDKQAQAYQVQQSAKDAPAAFAEAKAAAAQAEQDAAAAKAASDRAPDDAALKEAATDAQSEASDAETALGDAMDTLRQAPEALKSLGDIKPRPFLFWKEADHDELTPLPARSFVAKVYLTEKVLVLVCNAAFGDGSDINQVSVAANGPELNLMKATLNPVGAPGAPIDRVYVLDSKLTDDAITTVNFTIKPTSSGPADPVAIALVERHHQIRFSAGGGLLLTSAAAPSFSLATVPTVITTTTVVSTTITTATSTTTTTSTTPAVTAGTAEYVFKTVGNNPQMNGVAGLTFYPFGHDTFPVAGRRFTSTYAFHNPRQSLGIFAATSVNTLGNFTVAPAYEIFPGIQVFAGATWWSKSILQPNITACAGYGTSPSYQLAPPTTSTSTSTTAGPSPSTTNTTTTVTTNITSGCSNGDKASILSGTALPTQNTLQPSLGFGLVFNSNLFKYFSGLSGK